MTDVDLTIPPALDRRQGSFYGSGKWPRPYLTPSIARILMGHSAAAARDHCRYYDRGAEPPTPPTPAMTAGFVLDTFILGGSLGDLVIIEGDSFRSKSARDERDAALTAGKHVITRLQYEEIADQARIIRAHMPSLYGATIKRRLFWGDAPVCSTEPDIVHGDFVYDLKRTSIVPTQANWRRHVSQMRYQFQAAAAIEATQATQFGWIVVHGGGDVVVHMASAEYLEWAQQCWQDAKDIWQRCVKLDEFPGIHRGTIDPMPWDYPADAEDGVILSEEEEMEDQDGKQADRILQLVEMLYVSPVDIVLKMAAYAVFCQTETQLRYENKPSDVDSVFDRAARSIAGMIKDAERVKKEGGN